VTIPLGIYTILFLVASIATPELNPIPLISAFVLLVLFALVVKRYRHSNLPLSIYLATPLTILYTAITITVTPILSDQSGLQFKPYIKSSAQHTYIYGTYYTSIVKKSGTACEGTLHNSRVLNRNLEFKGHITIDDMTDTERLILSCAVRNLTGIGGKRNRGFGRIECTIDDKVFDLETLGGKLWNK